MATRVIALGLLACGASGADPDHSPVTRDSVVEADSDSDVDADTDVDSDSDVDSDADTDALPSSLPVDEFWVVGGWQAQLAASDVQLTVTSTATEGGADTVIERGGVELARFGVASDDEGLQYTSLTQAGATYGLEGVLFLPAELAGTRGGFDDGVGGWSNTALDAGWCSGGGACVEADALLAPDGGDQLHLVWTLAQGEGVRQICVEGTCYR